MFIGGEIVKRFDLNAVLDEYSITGLHVGCDRVWPSSHPLFKDPTKPLDSQEPAASHPEETPCNNSKPPTPEPQAQHPSNGRTEDTHNLVSKTSGPGQNDRPLNEATKANVNIPPAGPATDAQATDEICRLEGRIAVLQSLADFNQARVAHLEPELNRLRNVEQEVHYLRPLEAEVHWLRTHVYGYTWDRR